MKTNIGLLLFLCPFLNFGQYQFSGELSKAHTNKTVYLSLVENYRKSARIYADQIISKTTTDTLGQFTFEGDHLNEKNFLYRIHIDECDTANESAPHFLKECNYTQSLLFLAHKNDTISLPLLQTNQALCEINSTNNSSSLILEIDALKEEMILDFIEYPSKANETLNLRKWFSRLQDYGVQSGEPLAELYSYDFLSDRTNETHSYYMNDVKTNPYYDQLADRLQQRYGDAPFVVQYQNELAADKMIQETMNIKKKKPFTKYLLIGGVLFFSLVYVSVRHVFTKKKAQNIRLKTLTTQERTIMSKIGEGKSNKEIAIELFISLSTVKTHINNIYKKLGVTSREELKSLL